MYLPKSKYSEPKHTPGDEFLLGNEIYRGWYVVTFKGEYLTGKVIDNKSKYLQKIDPPERVDTRDLPSLDFYSKRVTPTDIDRKSGSWRRYFLQDTRTGKIVEVEKKKFDLFGTKNYITRGILDWKLKGPAQNVVKEKYVYYGAEYINRVNTEKLSRNMKGLSEFIKNYSEFVE